MKKVLCALCLPLLLLTACQTAEQNQGSKEQEEMKQQLTAPPLHLGAVYQVYPESHFAMIRLIGPRPAEGATLITHPADGSADRVGNLCVASGQHSREGLIAADIRSGTVIKGDRVFLYQRIAPLESREQDMEEQAAAGETPAPSTADIPAPQPSPATNDDTVIEEQPSVPAPTVDTSVLPEDETGTPTPDIPSPKLEGIPDTFDGWNN